MYGCIKILSIHRDDDLIARIRNLGYKFDDKDELSYYNSIIDLNRQITGILKVIEIKSFDFEKKYKKPDGARVDIEETMLLFTKHYGIIFNSKTLTTKQYIIYLKQYNKEISQVHG